MSDRYFLVVDFDSEVEPPEQQVCDRQSKFGGTVVLTISESPVWTGDFDYEEVGHAFHTKHWQFSDLAKRVVRLLNESEPQDE